MKRRLSLCLTLALMLILTACGSPAGQGGGSSNSAPDPSPSASDTPVTPPASQRPDSAPVEMESEGSEETGETKILIAYFSATNNTESIANHLESVLDADLYKIVPETPYTSADLNYNTDCRANREQNDPNARPAISGGVENMEQYDVIFLG